MVCCELEEITEAEQCGEKITKTPQVARVGVFRWRVGGKGRGLGD